jgi:hypothetical protein
MRLRRAAFSRRSIASLCAVSAVVVSWLTPAPTRAASVRELEVTRDEHGYRVASEAFLNAPPPAVFAVLTAYESFDRISSVYEASGFMAPASDGTPIVYTRVAACLLFFCKSIRRVERLEVDAPTYIRTTALPAHSDVVHSRSEWVLTAEDGGTRVTYFMEMKPAFPVPVAIGAWLLKRSLRKHGELVVHRVEELARQTTPGDQDDRQLHTGRLMLAERSTLDRARGTRK